MTKPMLEEIDITETQEFKEFQRRNFCCHVSYDDLERWYFRAANELNTLQAELLAAQAVNAKNGAVIAGQEAELAQVKGEREHYYDKFWELSRESSKTIIELEARLALAEPLLKALKESSDTHCLPVDVADEFEVYRQALAKPEGEKGEEHD
jgi:hypothetical protein